MTKNGTPYTDEQWQAWYAHKSNKEAWIEQEEATQAEIDTAIEGQYHSHTNGGHR